MNKNFNIWLKLSPLLIPFIAVFFGGVLLAIAQSFGLMSPIPLDSPWHKGYTSLFSDRRFWESLLFSLYVSLFSALIPAALGTVLAFAVWRLPAFLRPLAVVYKIPLVLPHLAAAFIVLVLWSQSGIISSLCHHLGLIDGQSDFPTILFAGNGLGLIAAYGFKGTSFVILLVYAMLQRLDRRLPLTASMLGASGIQIFFKIIIPHVRPAIHTSFIILFLYAFGAFDIPYLLSESRPGMLSIRAYDLYFKRDLEKRPEAMAILVFMFIFSCLAIYIYGRLTRKLDSGERKL